MGIGVSIRTWGELALFSRPEMKVERCSYDVITPSAARGVLEAIYWHPGIRWVIDKIYVLKPIQFTSIRRNEVKGKLSARNALSAMNGSKTQLYVSSRENIVQRASILLSDVEYVIDAHFELTDKANESDNSGKFKDIIIGASERVSVIIPHILAAGSFQQGLSCLRGMGLKPHIRIRKRIWAICFMT